MFLLAFSFLCCQICFHCFFQLYSTVLILVSTFLLLACMFAGSVYYNPFHTYNALESAIYGALHRAVWALGTLGMMFATSYGTYEFLHKCLSWKCWIPLSKLVYGAYLAHYAFQIRAAYNSVNPSEFNFFDVVSIFSFVYIIPVFITFGALSSPIHTLSTVFLLQKTNLECFFCL